jgi:hypothetical protein
VHPQGAEDAAARLVARLGVVRHVPDPAARRPAGA